ncbi:tetratricopeptide repeat protein [Chitinimonas koreensis]|nr:tetratricopeptide repeat protein [Chitinimonas koreensis]
MRRMYVLAATLFVLISGHMAEAAPMELPNEVHEKIVRLSKAGDALVEKSQYRAAVEKYIEALQLLPEPITDWEACTWPLTAIGDAHFLAGSHEYAQKALSDAMHCPGAVGNPFIHMRLGQAQFELGNMDRAADELARAYLQEGKKLFDGENPKYLAFIKTKLQPPPGGWPSGW